MPETAAVTALSGTPGAPGIGKDRKAMNAPVAHEIDTPCVKLCVVDPESGICIGCGRTRREIAGWIAMAPAERRGVMAGLDERLETLTRQKRRKGGARGRRNATGAA